MQFIGAPITPTLGNNLTFIQISSKFVVSPHEGSYLISVTQGVNEQIVEEAQTIVQEKPGKNYPLFLCFTFSKENSHILFMFTFALLMNLCP